MTLPLLIVLVLHLSTAKKVAILNKFGAYKSNLSQSFKIKDLSFHLIHSSTTNHSGSLFDQHALTGFPGFLNQRDEVSVNTVLTQNHRGSLFDQHALTGFQ
jgi:hypothetical protein